MSPDRPMNGWVRATWKGRWHQAEHDSRTNTAVLCCSGRTVRPYADEVMDYRWQPPLNVWCNHPPCREQVEP